MFALIISILAIILAIALAAISVYYGSDAFNGNKVKAEAATIINEASQIEASMAIYNAEHTGSLVVGGRTSDTGLFDYLLAEDYLKETPSGNGGVWEIKCSDSANQVAFEGDDNPDTCGPDGVVLTLSGVNPDQCNLINVLTHYTYTTDEDGPESHLGEKATSDGYVPTCTDEPNAPCCDG